MGGVSLGSLTSGALGALLATLGAFAVAYFTVRHDRSVVARREELEHTAQDRALRQRVAATARHVVHAFATEQRWSPLLQGQTELALLDLLGSAWADLGATEHSAVAEWISLRYDELAVLPTWRGWGRVLRSGHSRAAYAHELGLVAGQLTAWAAGRVDDSWFTTDLVHRSAL